MSKLEKTENKISQEERRKLIRTMLVRLSMLPPVLCLLVLLPAGTWLFWEFYVLMGVMFLPMIGVMIYFLRKDPLFLVRRMRSREKEKAQKLIQGVSSFAYLAGFIIPGLDKRYGWSSVPLWVVIGADVLVLLGYYLIFQVFRQNSYASRIVEVEEDQELISDGLYGVVRHPMYAAVCLMFFPMALALGSFWGLLPIATIPIFLVLRIRNEEKVLMEGLEGYKEYCKRVRFRLIPMFLQF